MLPRVIVRFGWPSFGRAHSTNCSSFANDALARVRRRGYRAGCRGRRHRGSGTRSAAQGGESRRRGSRPGHGRSECFGEGVGVDADLVAAARRSGPAPAANPVRHPVGGGVQNVEGGAVAAVGFPLSDLDGGCERLAGGVRPSTSCRSPMALGSRWPSNTSSIATTAEARAKQRVVHLGEIVGGERSAFVHAIARTRSRRRGPTGPVGSPLSSARRRPGGCTSGSRPPRTATRRTGCRAVWWGR